MCILIAPLRIKNLVLTWHDNPNSPKSAQLDLSRTATRLHANLINLLEKLQDTNKLITLYRSLLDTQNSALFVTRLRIQNVHRGPGSSFGVGIDFRMPLLHVQPVTTHYFWTDSFPTKSEGRAEMPGRSVVLQILRSSRTAWQSVVSAAAASATRSSCLLDFHATEFQIYLLLT